MTQKDRYSVILNRALNAALVIGAVVFVGLLIQKYHRNGAVARDAGPPIARGMKLPSLNLNQTVDEQVLLLAISSQCHFCTESAPLYRRITGEITGKHIRVVALLPQSVDEGRGYLRTLGVSADEVRQVNLLALGISTTPTVVLLDKEGVVDDVWVGKLSTNMEFSLLDRLRNDAQTARLSDDDYPHILAPELRDALAEKKSLIIVDVDGRKEFQAEHIPGAINIPTDELEMRAGEELRSASHIVLYCRCPSDGAAIVALDQLNKSDFKNVSVLRGGLAAWKRTEPAFSSDRIRGGT
jgi:rhodanese-related sulfurtransferase